MVLSEYRKRNQLTSHAPTSSPNEKDLDEVQRAVEHKPIFPTLQSTAISATPSTRRAPLGFTEETAKTENVPRRLIEPEEEEEETSFTEDRLAQVPVFVKLDRYRS